MNWIPVNEKLPGHQRMVLCYMPLSYNGYGGVHYGWLSPKLDHRGNVIGEVWKAHSPFSYAHDMESPHHTGTSGSVVTHWMPLPEPPEKL